MSEKVKEIKAVDVDPREIKPYCDSIGCMEKATKRLFLRLNKNVFIKRNSCPKHMGDLRKELKELPNPQP